MLETTQGELPRKRAGAKLGIVGSKNMGNRYVVHMEWLDDKPN